MVWRILIQILGLEWKSLGLEFDGKRNGFGWVWMGQSAASKDGWPDIGASPKQFRHDDDVKCFDGDAIGRRANGDEKCFRWSFVICAHMRTMMMMIVTKMCLGSRS